MYFTSLGPEKFEFGGAASRMKPLAYKKHLNSSAKR